MNEAPELKTSVWSRIIPTLIVRFFFFAFALGCVDLDEKGSKSLLSFHLDATDHGINMCVFLYWLSDTRPLIGLQLLPSPIGYIMWIPSHTPQDIDIDDDYMDLI